MIYNWKQKEIPPQEEVEDFKSALGTDATVSSLLLQRGIKDYDAAKAFFRPDLKKLHSPWLMKDMDKAVERVQKAIDNKEKILVYGDYDVDGTTAVSLMYHFLKSQYDNVGYYIPDRYAEGYGVSYTGIDYAAENGFSLIIALDCGIKAVDKVAYANEKGVDFIICDHHTPGKELPKAVAILNPKQSDCEYPFKGLCGCGVGFKLAMALAEKWELPETKLWHYLDLALISIAADLVPITGENRILAHYGLRVISKKPRPGVKALFDAAARKRKNLTITDVVFGVAPRINAAGRISHATAAVDLLLADNEDIAREKAEVLNGHNADRRDIDTTITAEALEMIATEDCEDIRSTVLFKEDWHKGVIGIVASRCIENYYRPTIILTASNGKATGSARSVNGFNVYEAIEECSDLLDQFGGHMYAAGLTMPVEHVPEFRRRFEEVVKDRILEEQLCPCIEIDLEIPLSQVSFKFQRLVAQMGPFGPENMQPIFCTRGVKDIGRCTVLKDKHLKLELTQDGSYTIGAIGFGLADRYELVCSGRPFDICYTVEVNEFRNERSLQLNIKDIRPQEEAQQ